MLLGTASATLLGLLFVVVSFNVRAVERGEHGQLRGIAAQTFNNFGISLILSLIMLVPKMSQASLSDSLIVIGFVGIAFVVSSLVNGVLQPKMALRYIQRMLLLPLFAQALIIYCGVEIMHSHFGALYTMIGVTIALIVSGSRAAWELLFRLGTDDSLRLGNASKATGSENQADA